jgi:hypothetical protein
MNSTIDIVMEDNVLEEISCCVCFSENLNPQEEIFTLTDIPLDKITSDILVKSTCGIHYICIKCLHTIVTDYTNHPINELNSHVYCPYPFKECLTPAGTKNIFEHNSILKILDDFEQTNFIAHSERFAFPGYTVITCPCNYFSSTLIQSICQYPILIENELIKSADIGDLIVQCHQNEKCCKTFCYHCRQEVSRYDRECRFCKLTSENENPNIFNRYFIKEHHQFEDVVYNDNIFDQTRYFDEDQYLFLNKEITFEIAIDYIIKLIEHNVHCICPICKIHLHKTERCNGMRHHNIERCYACGRIGTRTGGIPNNHWNPDGIGGCFRFDYDRFINKYIPDYKCNQNCQNHEQGDCTIDNHKLGIQLLNKLRQKSIIYHCINSLLPSIRYQTLDYLYDKYMNIPSAYELLPYKQTFIFTDYYKELILDYSEDTVYEHLNTQHPENITDFISKNTVMDMETYINTYPLPEPIVEEIQEIPEIQEFNIPIPPPNINVEQPIQTTITEIEELLNRMINDNLNDVLNESLNETLNETLNALNNINEEMQPLINTSSDDTLTDILESYIPLDNNETDIEPDSEEVDNIRIYYNVSDIYTLGSDSDSELDITDMTTND